jgi:predicted XRE-type DNA-binding protein
MEAKHIARFERKVDRENGPICEKLGTRCHEWQASRDDDGYGWFKFPGGNVSKAHRFALTLKLGRPLQPGMQSQHLCNNPPCCNPDHLVEGLPKQNSHQMVLDGRSLPGDLNPSKTADLPRGEDWHAAHPKAARDAVMKEKCSGDRHWTKRDPARRAAAAASCAAARVLTEDMVRDIRQLAQDGFLQREIASHYGLSQTTISNAVSGRQWAHVEGALQDQGAKRIRRGSANPRASIDEATALLILREGAAGTKQARIAERLGISKAVVNNVLIGNAWTHVAPEIPRGRTRAPYAPRNALLSPG